MSAYISRNNLSLLSQSQAAQRQTGILPECLSLLPQGKDCTRDQNRKVTGGGGGLEMGLTKVKHTSPRKQNVVVVSGAWRLGPASDQNLIRAFLVERHWQPRGVSSHQLGARCGASGILECLPGRVRVGVSRNSAFPGWAGVERRKSAWPGPGQLATQQASEQEPQAGTTTRRKGPTVSLGQPQSPPARLQPGHCVLSALTRCSPSPLLRRPPAAWRDEAKCSQGPGEHQPTHSFLPPRALKSCFPSVSGFPKVTLVTPAEDGGTARGQEAGGLLYVTLDKSLLSES